MKMNWSSRHRERRGQRNEYWGPQTFSLEVRKIGKTSKGDWERMVSRNRIERKCSKSQEKKVFQDSGSNQGYQMNW